MCFSTIVFKDGKPNRQAELLACTSSINWTCRAKQFSRGSLDLDWSNSSKREQKIYRVRMLLCACRFTNRLLGICVEWQEVQITALTFPSFVSVCFLLLWWPGVADFFTTVRKVFHPTFIHLSYFLHILRNSSATSKTSKWTLRLKVVVTTGWIPFLVREGLSWSAPRSEDVGMNDLDSSVCWHLFSFVTLSHVKVVFSDPETKAETKLVRFVVVVVVVADDDVVAIPPSHPTTLS